jgi:hypothetical protein
MVHMKALSDLCSLSYPNTWINNSRCRSLTVLLSASVIVSE